MSGRDLRSFLEEHRAGTFSLSQRTGNLLTWYARMIKLKCLLLNYLLSLGLQRKYLAGGIAFGSRFIREVDYDRLLGEAQDCRTTAQLQAKKLKALSQQGRESKAAWFLRLHQGVWQHEWSRLVTERLRVEGEIERWRVDAIAAAQTGEETGWMEEITQYMAQLQREREEFELGSINAMQQVHADLKSWLSCPESERGDSPKPADLQMRCDLVKEQQRGVEAALQEQFLRLWHDVEEFDGGGDKKYAVPIGTVPASLLQCECSNSTLKASLVEQFHALNQHYQLVLQNITKKHLG